MINTLRKHLNHSIVLFVLLLIAGVILSLNLDKPFWGHHDWNGAYWGNVARNFTKYGIFQTKLGMIYNVGLTSPDNFAYTFHFSPLYPLLLSFSYWLFGVSEITARGLSVILSVSTLLVFYQLIRIFYKIRIARSALIFWICTPMFIYFGKMPVHDILILLLAVSTLYFFFAGNKKLSVAFALLAQLSGWPGYSVVVALTAVVFIYDKKSTFVSKLIKIIPFWSTSLVVFASLVIHDRLLTGSFFGGGLSDIFFARIRPVALFPYLKILFRWSLTYFTPLMLAFSFIGLLLLTFKKIKSSEVVLSLILFASVYPIISRDSSSRHDYLLIYFLPAITLSASLFLDKLFSKKLVFYALVIASALLIVKTRLPFMIALQKSDIYKESVLLGKYVHQNTNIIDKTILVLENDDIPFDGWHFSYYADRDTTIVRDARIPEEIQYRKKFTYKKTGDIILSQ